MARRCSHCEGGPRTGEKWKEHTPYERAFGIRPNETKRNETKQAGRDLGREGGREGTTTWEYIAAAAALIRTGIDGAATPISFLDARRDVHALAFQYLHAAVRCVCALVGGGAARRSRRGGGTVIGMVRKHDTGWIL